MSFMVRCPRCHQPLSVEESHAGQAAKIDGAAREAALRVIAEIGRDANSNTMLTALAELQRSEPSRAIRDAARDAYLKTQRN